jgi:hypothetical protein
MFTFWRQSAWLRLPAERQQLQRLAANIIAQSTACTTYTLPAAQYCNNDDGHNLLRHTRCRVVVLLEQPTELLTTLDCHRENMTFAHFHLPYNSASYCAG